MEPVPGCSICEDLPLPANERPGSPLSKPEAQTGKQRPGRQFVRLLNALAAVLIVGVLVGAFLVLLNSHRGRSGATELHPGSSGATWCVVSSPNRAGGGTILNGVAATSASDAWAVGSSNSSAGIFQPVIEHWNGSRWSIVASRNVGGEGGRLRRGMTPISAYYSPAL